MGILQEARPTCGTREWVLLTCSGSSRSPLLGSGRNLPPGRLAQVCGGWGVAFLCSIEYHHSSGLGRKACSPHGGLAGAWGVLPSPAAPGRALAPTPSGRFGRVPAGAPQRCLHGDHVWAEEPLQTRRVRPLGGPRGLLLVLWSTSTAPPGVPGGASAESSPRRDVSRDTASQKWRGSVKNCSGAAGEPGQLRGPPAFR